MKEIDKLKETLEEIHKLAEESVLYLPKLESLDHEEKEPLIKDEKIRKIIRAWADANDSTMVEYKIFKNEFVDGYLNIIGFNRRFKELCDRSYTITELCGEDK